MNRRTIDQPAHRIGLIREHKMHVTAGCDTDLSRPRKLSILSFQHFGGANTVQAGNKAFNKLWPHVLHNKDRWAIRWKGR